MGTHSDTSGAAGTNPTRESILAAADEVVRSRGLRATTTRLIAGAAGCSEGSIYNHFANKDELIAAVVCERLAAFPERARRMPELAGTGEVATNLAELAALAIDFFAEVAPMTAAMMAEPASMRRHVVELDAAGKGPRWTIRALVEYLRREQRLGRVAADAHLEGAAMALVGGALHQAHLVATWEVEVFAPDRDAATELARAVTAGLCAQSPRADGAARSERS